MGYGGKTNWGGEYWMGKLGPKAQSSPRKDSGSKLYKKAPRTGPTILRKQSNLMLITGTHGKTLVMIIIKGQNVERALAGNNSSRRATLIHSVQESHEFAQLVMKLCVSVSSYCIWDEGLRWYSICASLRAEEENTLIRVSAICHEKLKVRPSDPFLLSTSTSLLLPSFSISVNVVFCYELSCCWEVEGEQGWETLVEIEILFLQVGERRFAQWRGGFCAESVREWRLKVERVVTGWLGRLSFLNGYWLELKGDWSQLGIEEFWWKVQEFLVSVPISWELVYFYYVLVKEWSSFLFGERC